MNDVKFIYYNTLIKVEILTKECICSSFGRLEESLYSYDWLVLLWITGSRIFLSSHALGISIYDFKKLNLKLTFLTGFDTSGKNAQDRFRNLRQLTGQNTKIKIQLKTQFKEN